jgi:hypothetical protein
LGSIYQHSRGKTGGTGIHLLLLSVALALSACGGGGDAPASSPPVNRVPTVSAGADQSVAELTVVNLNGSGSDPDAGDTLTFAWTQTAGQSITINNANTANADFMAPDVTAGTPEVLTFQLAVSDGNGGNATDTTDITVQEPQAMVTISGKVQYEFVPPNVNCNGLNFNGKVPRPIRQATVQILDATTDTVIDTIVSNDIGEYSFTVVANTMLFLRVRAELKHAGPSPSWNVEVRDNVVDPMDPSPPPLSQRPLYVLDGTDFDSGTIDKTIILTAETGWGANSYTAPRSAAPFAVLDTIYSMILSILAEEPLINFPALDAFWSINNVPASGGGGLFDDIDSGDLGTSFYLGGSFSSLFLLGDEVLDTEEFDDHVIAHEWGHYFEDKFSRSDSIGGSHGLGDSLDMRVAFGEGFATALAGIGLRDPIYCDTQAAGGNSGFGFDIEKDTPGIDGWFNEFSVLNFIYDLWDSNDDAAHADTGSIGFGPIYDVMSGPQVITPAFTSIFSFAAELRARAQNPVAEGLIDALLGGQGITAVGIDIYGTTESNDANGEPDVLPVFRDVPIGTTFQICSNTKFDFRRDGNKLSEHRFLKMNVPSQSQYMINIATINPPSAPPAGFDCTDPANVNDPNIHMHSDPDIEIYRDGQWIWEGTSCEANSEVTSTPVLAAGDYVLSLVEFRYSDEDSPQGFPEQICFDVTIGP